MTSPDTDRKGRRSTGFARIPLVKALSAHRPAVSPMVMNLLVAGFLLATANATFLDRVSAYLSGNPGLVPVAAVLAYAAILFCVSLFTLPGLVRPVLALALVLVFAKLLPAAARFQTV